MVRVTNSVELNAAIAAGNEQEIILAPGLYGPVEVRGQTIIAEQRWRSVFVPDYGLSDRHNVYGHPGSTIIGVQSRNSLIDGIKVEDECEVRDCWVRHANGDGIASHSTMEQGNTVIEGNLVEFCGSHIQGGHAVYASGRNITVARNIWRHCSGRALHLYPHLVDSKVHHNVCFNQACGRGSVIFSQGGNLIAHNTFVDFTRALHVDGQQETDTVANNLVCGEYEATLDGSNWAGTDEAAGFVSRFKGVLWLRGNSPCVSGGVPLEAITEDFWGDPMATEIYRGAFAFREAMEREVFRNSWENGWPYAGRTPLIPDPLTGGQAGVIS